MNKRTRMALVENWCAAHGLPCFWCQRDFGAKVLMATVDHFIPLSRMGEDSKHNAVIAHQNCNSCRSNRFPTEHEMRRFVRMRGKAGVEMLRRYAERLERGLRA